MWNWWIDHNGTLEVWTSAATVLAALAAVGAAFLSYLQVRSIRSAECVPSLSVVGSNKLALRITNHGGTAKRVKVRYSKVSGPNIIRLQREEIVLRNGIDIMQRGETREFLIRTITDINYFRQDHQLLAQALEDDDAIDAAEKRPPVVIRCILAWQEPGTFRERGETYLLFADKPMVDRSERAQIFPRF